MVVLIQSLVQNLFRKQRQNLKEQSNVAKECHFHIKQRKTTEIMPKRC